MSTNLLTTSPPRATCGEAPCNEVVICRCLNVTEGDVQMAISTFNVQTVRELGRCTGAGKGCMACHSRLRALITQRNS